MGNMSENIPENVLLGENLKRLREDQCYTQEGLAKISGTTKNFISDIERGNRGAGRITMRKLCDALMVDEVTLRFGKQGSSIDRRRDNNQILRMLVTELLPVPETDRLAWVLRIRRWKESHK